MAIKLLHGGADDEALRERLNKALGEIVANGTYQKIASKYFAFDIYN